MITADLIKELRNITAPERVMEAESLAGHCSFRTGGPADLFIQVHTAPELWRSRGRRFSFSEGGLTS